MINYRNGFDDFINYTLSNMIIISGGDIIYPCTKRKNKKFLDLDDITMYFYIKCSWRNIDVGFHTENHMFLTRPC